jgi:hypothetical protein
VLAQIRLLGGEHDPCQSETGKSRRFNAIPGLTMIRCIFERQSQRRGGEASSGPEIRRAWLDGASSRTMNTWIADPGRVGHGESYGCIRLMNWDASTWRIWWCAELRQFSRITMRFSQPDSQFDRA